MTYIDNELIRLSIIAAADPWNKKIEPKRKAHSIGHSTQSLKRIIRLFIFLRTIPSPLIASHRFHTYTFSNTLLAFLLARDGAWRPD
jgi:hypothetical protein